MRWTRKSIIAEIKKLHAQGAELNYASAEAEHLNLVRAAAWHFGTWRRAVEAAGISYESVGKYRRWNRERIIERIRELAAQGADLSWRSISNEVDPPLAAAALRPNGFNSWREAIAAAGLDINDVARYQLWDEARVLSDIKALHRARAPLSSKVVQSTNQPLFCAARRRFGSWDEAIAAAGYSVDKTRLRRPAHEHDENDAPSSGASNTVAHNGSAPAKKPKAPTPKVTAEKTAASKKTDKAAPVKTATAKSAAPKKVKASGTRRRA